MCLSDAIDTTPNPDSGADADPEVEPNVISAQVLNINTEKQPSQVDSDSIVDDNHMPTHPTAAIDPKRVNLDDISLNSPSSEIVGTPFAIDSTRFEYPFPDTNGSGSSSTTFDFTPSSSPSSSSFPTSPSSRTFPTTTSSRVLPQLSFPPAHPSYNTVHPKMKLHTNPPIPPNLVKRRLRWNLKLGRRKSSTGSQQSLTSDDCTTANLTDGQAAVASPSGQQQAQP